MMNEECLGTTQLEGLYSLTHQVAIGRYHEGPAVIRHHLWTLFRNRSFDQSYL